MRDLCKIVFCVIYSGTREVAAVLVPPVGFHHLDSAACVPGDFASCAEHFQSHNNRGSEPQTSSRGMCLYYRTMVGVGGLRLFDLYNFRVDISVINLI